MAGVVGPNSAGVNGVGGRVYKFVPKRRGGQEPWHIGCNRRWTSWEAWHLAEGAKIALDYLNLPGRATVIAANVQKEDAKMIATTARHWAEHCELVDFPES